ncbi:GDP-L-fucose synthase [subsurface metagenome]
MPSDRKLLVLGATGFVGRTVCRLLDERGRDYTGSSLSAGVDLRDETQAIALFKQTQPEYVLNCAAFVGGIQFGYDHPGEIFRNNLPMSVNILESCRQTGVKRLVNPISNCAYPARATLFKESEFWEGPLHESVMVYGMARKMSWVGAWAYNKQYGVDIISLILSNMYGPGDHFDPVRSHALGALIKKMVDAKEQSAPFVTVWGTGKPVREWLFVEDGAEAIIRALEIEPYLDPINIGVAQGVSIKELANMIKSQVGYEGELRFDLTKPDGAAFKTVDGSQGKKLLGWQPKIGLQEGIRQTVQWYLTDADRLAVASTGHEFN